MTPLKITLALPPSTNRIWRVMRGTMVKSADYRVWKAVAAWSVANQMGGQAPLRHFTVLIVLPETRRDPDNSIKPILDALQAGGAIRNDRELRALTLTVDAARTLDSAFIQLDAADAPPPKPRKRRARKAT